MDTRDQNLANLDLLETSKRKRNNKDKNNQRRFSDEQIKLLETMFESETRLEPKKKLEIARELGLQPRQVAIWFQNRRARWKSKQIEQDFRALRAQYDNLASKFESLQEEKQSLLTQLNKLNDLTIRHTDRENGTKSESESAKPNSKERDILAQTCDDMVDDFGQQQEVNELVVVANPSNDIDTSLMSIESWYKPYEQGGLFDQTQPRSCSQWLNFWS